MGKCQKKGDLKLKWCFFIVLIVVVLAFLSAEKEKKALETPMQFAPLHETRGRRGRDEVQPESIPRGVSRGRGRLYPDAEGR